MHTTARLWLIASRSDRTRVVKAFLCVRAYSKGSKQKSAATKQTKQLAKSKGKKKGQMQDDTTIATEQQQPAGELEAKDSESAEEGEEEGENKENPDESDSSDTSMRRRSAAPPKKAKKSHVPNAVKPAPAKPTARASSSSSYSLDALTSATVISPIPPSSRSALSSLSASSAAADALFSSPVAAPVPALAAAVSHQLLQPCGKDCELDHPPANLPPNLKLRHADGGDLNPNDPFYCIQLAFDQIILPASSAVSQTCRSLHCDADRHLSDLCFADDTGGEVSYASHIPAQYSPSLPCLHQVRF
jgi:hypothetical protein